MTEGPPAAGAPFTVLLVCTGNICRSALAERLARARLREAPGEVARGIRIVSAGTRAVVGSAMHPESARVLAGLGGEPGGFRARQLREDDVAAADLVLAMTRDHRREILGMSPRALARTFTLLEAADLAALIGLEVQPGGSGPAGSAHGLVRAMAAARSRHRGGPDDDVPDPVGGPPAAHEAAGNTIAGALVPLLDRLVAAVRAPSYPAG